uniref:Uncharacterized protein n=1 Tax=Macrostomum lignano TaxID=282301 RepID=A0A1I8HND5_9PLAT
MRTYEGQVNSVSSLAPHRPAAAAQPQSPVGVRPNTDNLDQLLENLLEPAFGRRDIESEYLNQQQQQQQQHYQRQRQQPTRVAPQPPPPPPAAAPAVEPISDRERLLLEELARA